MLKLVSIITRRWARSTKHTLSKSCWKSSSCSCTCFKTLSMSPAMCERARWFQTGSAYSEAFAYQPSAKRV